MATDEDLRAAHARIGRVEADVKAQQTKLGEVAEKVQWIKGYLQTRPEPAVPVFKRDAGMVVGGGGIVGTIMFVLEKIFGTGAVP